MKTRVFNLTPAPNRGAHLLCFSSHRITSPSCWLNSLQTRRSQHFDVDFKTVSLRLFKGCQVNIVHGIFFCHPAPCSRISLFAADVIRCSPPVHHRVSNKIQDRQAVVKISSLLFPLSLFPSLPPSLSFFSLLVVQLKNVTWGLERWLSD